MTTREEFLEIVEKHLKVGNAGSILIEDPALAKKYSEYLKQFASKEGAVKGLNGGCVNVVCWD